MSLKVYVKKFPGLVVPNKANAEDAGYDVVATSEPKIAGNSIILPNGKLGYKSIQYIEYETNLAISPQESCVYSKFDKIGEPFSETIIKTRVHTLCHPRSSISEYNLILANSVGLIDQGYRNQIVFRFKYVFQPKDFSITDHHVVYGKVDLEKIYKKGDRIGQLVFANTLDVEFELVDDLAKSSRGLGGWGSSGT
jgi:dUTP pyrophosphatase